MDLSETADDLLKTDISPNPEKREPEDKGKMAYYLMILFGIGALLPWNAILTSLDFFKAKVKLYILNELVGWISTGFCVRLCS